MKKIIRLWIVLFVLSACSPQLLATAAPSAPVQLLVDLAAQSVVQKEKLGACTTELGMNKVHAKQKKVDGLGRQQIQKQFQLCQEVGEGSVAQVSYKAEDLAVKAGNTKVALLLAQEGEVAQRGWYHSFCVNHPHWHKLIGFWLCGIGGFVGGAVGARLAL